MTEKVRKNVITASILGVSIILSILSLPILSMSLDVSFVALIIGRRYVGVRRTLLVALIYPWFTMYIMTPVGSLFMMLQALAFIMLDYWIIKDGEYTIGKIFSILILITLWSTIINFVLICPMYYYLSGLTDGPGWSTALTSGSDYAFLKYEFAWMITTIIFNPIKVSIIYAITYGLWIALENSLNLEPNDLTKSEDKLEEENNESQEIIKIENEEEK